MSAPLAPPLRVLIVDDSAASRRALTAMLELAPDVQVVGRAADGEEGLKLARSLAPDVITLDLEMPKLDGYTFLRVLQATRPTPVVVVSSYGHEADVFKALQLGAFDFVARPASDGQLATIRADLLEKLRATRQARRPLTAVRSAEDLHVLLVGASTGGPPAVQRVLEALVGLPVCVLVAQHMPAGFTQAFAERLDQVLPFRVQHAKTGDVVGPGLVFIAPGDEHLELVERAQGVRLVTTPKLPKEPHAPSVDRLFLSAARVSGVARSALVLTGMGDDGAKGAQALHAAGVTVWAEAESSAVVFGMPSAAIATGAVSRTLPLTELCKELPRLLGFKARVSKLR